MGEREGRTKEREGGRNKRARESSQVGEIYGADSIQCCGQQRHEEDGPRVSGGGTGKRNICSVLEGDRRKIIVEERKERKAK